MRRRDDIETVEVPASDMAFVDARIDDLVRHCCHDPNIVESVARSCYLQGLADGVQLAGLRPELIEELRTIELRKEQDHADISGPTGE